MKQLLRTVDPVFLSWVQAVLRSEGIEPILLDQHMSSMEAFTIAVPRRLMVEDEDLARARRILEDAGEGHRLD